MNAAVVLRYQHINGVPRSPGDYLSLEEYEGIDASVRDAMESQGEIKKIVDAEAARIIETLEAKQVALETRIKALEDLFQDQKD